MKLTIVTIATGLALLSGCSSSEPTAAAPKTTTTPASAPTTTSATLTTTPAAASTTVDNSKLLNDPDIAFRTILEAKVASQSAETNAAYCAAYAADPKGTLSGVERGLNQVLTTSVTDKQRAILVNVSNKQCA